MAEELTHGPVKILLVDDRPGNLMALRAILEQPDYEMIEVTSGADALAHVLREDFAVILLDVAMPGMDGFETARLIKQRERSSQIPIIFVTASIYDLEHIYKGYSVGAVDYLQKPLEPHVVRAKVAVFVELHRHKLEIARQRELLEKHAAEALAVSEAQYQATFDQAPVGLAHVGLDGRWLRVNPRLSEILGYASEELHERRFEDVLHVAERGQVHGVLDRLLAGEAKIFRSEVRFQGARGTDVWANVTLALQRDASAARRFLVILEDVSDRKRAEQAQRFLSEASALLLSSLDYVTTLQGVARLATRELCERCIVDVMNGESRVFAHPAETEALLADLRREVAESGHPRLIGRAEPELQREGLSSAMIVPLVARGRGLGALSFFAGESVRAYGPADLAVATDLGVRAAFALDNARLYHDAEEAIHARDEFLSIASHELKTPLTPLYLQVQSLLRILERSQGENVSRERLGGVLVRAERQLARLTSLIDDLLDVSRISSGRLRLLFEDVDLVEIVKEVVGRFDEPIRRAGSDVSVTAPAHALGRWDRLRIEQVVTNLLSNAVKYGEGRKIEIEIDGHGAGDVDGEVSLVVHDLGIGIPPAKIARIFDRFERAVSAQSYGGLGLGLYITRQIVEAHGGHISVSSEPGRGATFRVTLPAVPARRVEHVPATITDS